MGDGLQAALPRELYVDPHAWSAEREAVLFGEWYCLGRTDDLGLAVSGQVQPGRVLTVDVAGESVLVTSDEDGRLHAAYNVCRHRGSQPDRPRRRPATPLRCAAHTTRGPTPSTDACSRRRTRRSATPRSSRCTRSASRPGAASSSCT